MSPPRKAQPPVFSTPEFRASLAMFATGVTIVTARTAAGALGGSPWIDSYIRCASAPNA